MIIGHCRLLESPRRLIDPGIIERAKRSGHRGPVLRGLGRRDRSQCEVINHVTLIAVPCNLSLEVCRRFGRRRAVCQFGEVAYGPCERRLPEGRPDIVFPRRVYGSEALDPITRVRVSRERTECSP